MKNILIIGASSSKESINKAFANYAGTQIQDAKLHVLDLNDFAMPLYSVDEEAASGIPQLAVDFVSAVESCDGVIISFAEHNGSYTVAFKNILDWGTRHKQKIWSDKPALLLSTSPGARGGATVLAAADQTFPHLGAKVVGSFALPSYYDYFSVDTGINENDLQKSFLQILEKFTQAI